MGIDSTLLINAKYTVKDVVKVLTALGIESIEEDHKGDHSFLRFELKDSYKRQLLVMQDGNNGGLDSLLLSYRMNPEGIELLRKIAKVTGGFLQADDSTDAWEEIQAPHDGNAKFILKHQILTRALTSADSKDLADRVAEATGYQRPGRKNDKSQST